MIIIITGLPGSGKSTLASMLRQKRFRIIEISTILKAKMRKEGISISVANLEAFGMEMKKADPKLVGVAREAASHVAGSKLNAAISGVRCIEQVDAIRRRLRQDAWVIAATSPKLTRYGRLSRKSRMRVENMGQMSMRDHSSVSQGANELIRSADFIISNVGTKKELRKELDTVLSLIKDRRPTKSRQ